MEQGYGCFSPVWVRSCLVTLSFVLNLLVQMEQGYRSCLVTLFFVLNFLRQMDTASPVWVRSCLVMLNFVLNVSAQMEQIWGFSSAWVRSCAAAWPFWPNFFTGACKRHFPLLVPAYGTLLATRLQ